MIEFIFESYLNIFRKTQSNFNLLLLLLHRRRRGVEPLDEELLAFGVEVEELPEREVIDGEGARVDHALGVGEVVALFHEEVERVPGDDFGFEMGVIRVSFVDFLDQGAPDYNRVSTNIYIKYKC